MVRKILTVAFIAGITAAGYYGMRLLPLLTTDNASAEKVVLLHGLGRTEYAMLLLESALTRAGFDVYNIGYPSNEAAPGVLVDTITEEIERCCNHGGQRVHFVGHSLGGLLIRAYLGGNEVAQLGRVVLLGSPNKGSELADAEHLGEVVGSVLQLAGPTALALNTGPDGFAASLPSPDYPVGVIAGSRGNPVSNEWLPVPNDGMVSVDSAKLDGMVDFVVYDLTHWQLRNDAGVAAQVVAFLSQGRFNSTEQ